MKKLALIGALALAAGCAGQAQQSQLAAGSGSLAALKGQAQREQITQCLKDATRAYPNVPAYMVWDSCHEAAGYPHFPQRMGGL